MINGVYIYYSRQTNGLKPVSNKGELVKKLEKD